MGVLALGWILVSTSHAVVVEPSDAERRLAQLIAEELDRRHLASDTLFEMRRPMVGDMILNAIDPSRSFLTTADLDRIEVSALPEAIERGQLKTVYQLYGVMLNRSEARLDYWLETLAQGTRGLNLTDDENLPIRDRESPWLNHPSELQDLWRKQLENQAINLLLADRTLEDTIDALTRRFESQKNRLEQTRPDDVFTAVINAYASAYDPHTSYLPPADSETFNINMSLSLQGIGAVLQTED